MNIIRKLESFGICEDETMQKQQITLENYSFSSIYYKTGRYHTKLPWKENSSELPTNIAIAKLRTQNVIKRLSREPDMLTTYSNVIAEQEKRDFIEKVDTNNQQNTKMYYIPHHPVKKDSTTTPIRVVYDCSCRENQRSPSLNDCLESHSLIMNDLTRILTRFRTGKYATSSVIEKAVLQVSLDDKDRDVTRSFWLSNPKAAASPLTTYRFKLILFVLHLF